MIKTQITEMLGIKYPIIAAPMGPFYTTELTVAVSEAGGLGVLSHTNLFGKSSIDEMIKNMEYVVDHTSKPFGFNIRTSRMQPDSPTLCRKIPDFIRENQKVRDQCIYALTSAGSPNMLKTKAWEKLKEGGSKIKHFHVAPVEWLAEKCIKAGVDGLVVTGNEGGGHQSYEKVNSLVLYQQIKKSFPTVPFVACGGIATGEGLAAALCCGAGAVAMGSRFIASKESEFHQNYKDIIPPAKAEDTVLVTGFLGPIRLWKNNYSEHHGLVASKEDKVAEEASFTAEDLIEDQKHYEKVYNGDIIEGAVLLGQSIGIIEKIEPVKDIIAAVMADAEKAIKKTASLVK